MKFLKSVFKINNIGSHKIITVAGIKIKLKSKKLVLLSKIEMLEKELKKSNNKLTSSLSEIKKLKKEDKAHKNVIEKNNISKQNISQKYKQIIQDKNITIEKTNEKLTKTVSLFNEERQMIIKAVDKYLQDRLEYLDRNINDDNNIAFSVIMPTYNRAYCIKNAIDSLLNQFYQNFELIIADDASTDNTEELIKQEYSKQLEENKIIYKKFEINEGPPSARNKALEFAKNDWIAYLDSDNTIRPYFLSEFAYNISKNKYLSYYAAFQKKSGVISNNVFNYDKLLKANYIDLGIFVHHKSLIDKYGPFDPELKACEDWDLFIKYTKDNPPFHIPVVLLDYTDDNNSNRISSNNSNIDEAVDRIKKRYNI